MEKWAWMVFLYDYFDAAVEAMQRLRLEGAAAANLKAACFARRIGSCALVKLSLRIQNCAY